MKSIFVSILAMAFLAVSAPGLAAAPVLFLTDERPPFEMAKPDGSVGGVAADCVKCVMKKMGRAFSIKIVPWARAQSEVKAGKAHGFFSASRNAKRDQYAVLSATVADQYWNWYLKADSKLDPNSPDFKASAKTGSWFGSNSLRWLKKKGYKVGSDAKNTELLMKQLMAGRMDAAFGSNFAFKEAIAKMGAASKVKEVKGLHKPMGVYFEKKFLAANPDFLDKFNKLVPGCSK